MIHSSNTTYPFPNTSLEVIDRTVQLMEDSQVMPVNFNILIAGKFDKGETNKLVQFYPGQAERQLKKFGLPNYPKFGIGPDLAQYALKQTSGNIGVLMINLRGSDAAYANVVLSVKHKIVEDKPKLDDEGQPLYLTPDGTETTVADGNTAIVRDVLTAKFVKSTVASVNTVEEFEAAIDALYSDTADTDGFKTIPLFGTMYRGASIYGNNVYFRLLDMVSSLDKKVFYTAEVFDGDQTRMTEIPMSMFAGETYKGEDSFMETIMNNTFEDLHTISSLHADKFTDLLLQHVKDVAPAKLNVFDPENYYYEVDPTSLDVTAAKAFMLQNGSDGTDTLEDCLTDFYTHKIIKDLKSVVRYQINYIPDLEYTENVKTAIETFLVDRNRTSKATLMRGAAGSFESAITDRDTNHFQTAYDVRQLAKCQSAVAFNEYTKRNHRMPASYFDTKALIDSIVTNGHPYAAFAGADVRWGGFLENSLMVPDEDATILTKLSNARINVVKMDNQPGAYIHEQNMNTEVYSDQTEFNNSMLLGSMVSEVAKLIHENNYKFNDLAEVGAFQEKVKLDLNPKYQPYSAAMSVKVFKAANSGALKNTNVIQIIVNFKDLAKDTKVQFILTDDL